MKNYKFWKLYYSADIDFCRYPIFKFLRTFTFLVDQFWKILRIWTFADDQFWKMSRSWTFAERVKKSRNCKSFCPWKFLLLKKVNYELTFTFTLYILYILFIWLFLKDAVVITWWFYSILIPALYVEHFPLLLVTLFAVHLMLTNLLRPISCLKFLFFGNAMIGETETDIPECWIIFENVPLFFDYVLNIW